MARCLVIATMAAVWIACSLPGRATAAGPDLRSMALHGQDLPRGAILYVSRFWTDAQAALRDRVPVSVYQRHRRLLSYETEFNRPLLYGRVEVSGLDLARAEITRFRSARGATWYFRHLQPILRHDFVAGTTTGGTMQGGAYHRFPYFPSLVPAVADQVAAYTAGWAADEYAYSERALVFRDGRYVVLLHINGVEGRTPLDLAVRLARLIAGRIAAADPPR